MNKCPWQNWDCDEHMPCSDCYWPQNRTSKRVRFIQWFILGLAIVFSVMLLFKYFAWSDARYMETEYCWDEDGNHYVAPNYNCI